VGGAGCKTAGHAAIQPPPPQPGSSGDLARKLGVDVSTVSRLAALGHDEQLLGMVETGELGLTTASHLARLPGPLRRQMPEQPGHAHLSSRVVHVKVNELLRERGQTTGEFAQRRGDSALPAGGVLHRLKVVLGPLASIERVETDQGIRGPRADRRARAAAAKILTG
jgi:hypothetical protein